MKPDNDRPDTIEAHLGLFRSPPADQISAAEERAVERLRYEPLHIAASASSPSGLRAHWRLAFACAAAGMLIVVVARMPESRRPIPRADAGSVVEAADGALYIASNVPARVSDVIALGTPVRTESTGAVLALADGSRVEMRSQSEILLERADEGIRIRLNTGGIIVNAAKQRTGHLYVQTKDITVSVVGTVFLVNADETGSRVAVIEGEVRVQQGTREQNLRPGQQVATNPSIDARPVRDVIAWSRNAPALISLLQQSTVVPPALTRQNPAAPRETFEVTSIRLRTPAAPGGRGGPGPDGQEPKCYGDVQLDQRRLALTNMMLYRVITLAYGKSCYEYERMDLLSGGARWVTADRYDIEATLPEGTPTYTREQFDPARWGRAEPSDASRLHAMLQAMLADRFKLIVKRETREIPGFVLSVARGGPRLTAWKNGERATLGAVTGGSNANGEWRSIVRGEKLSMPRLANQLMLVTQRPVVDRTGILGDFNYSIEFTPFSPPPDFVTRGAPMVTGPSLFTALEETMGLRLEPARVPVEFLVIERIERPSEN